MKTKNILKSTLAVVAVTASSFGAWKAYGTYGSVNNSLMMENIEALSQDGDNGSGGGHYPEPVNCGTIPCSVATVTPWQWGQGNICNPCCTSYQTAEQLKEEKSAQRKSQCWCTGPRQNLDASTQQRYGWCFPKSHY